MAGNYFYYIDNSNRVMCNGGHEGDWSGCRGITGLSGFEENVGDGRRKEGQGLQDYYTRNSKTPGENERGAIRIAVAHNLDVFHVPYQIHKNTS